MIRLILTVAALLVFGGPAQAGVAFLLGTGAGSAPPAGCAQATTFLARTSVNTAHQNAYTAMICRMVSDGIITGDLSSTNCGSKLDWLYILATADETTALLNICGTQFLAPFTVGSPNFTADQGYLGVDGSGVYIDLRHNPAGGGAFNFVQNSAHLGFFSLTNAAGSTGQAIGATSGTSPLTYALIYPKYTDGNAYICINDDCSEAGAAMADTRGLYLATRTGATSEAFYKNGALVFTSSNPSNANVNSAIVALAVNFSGTICCGWPGRLAMVMGGGGLSATDAANIKTAVCLYSAQIGATWVGC